MTTHTVHHESAREKGWDICLALVLAIAGFFMTLYSAAIITGLIVGWLAHPY
jgi:hypothetical protein